MKLTTTTQMTASFKGRSIFTLIMAGILLSALALHANGGTSSYTYDSLNRLTKLSFENSFTTTFSFDPAGNRLTLTTSAISAPLRGTLGSYQGVIIGTSGPSVAGLIKLSISISGGFTGHLVFDGKTYRLKGQFQPDNSGNWTWSGTISRPGLSTLYINLQTSADGDFAEITGNISDGGTFTANISLDRAVFNAKISPALLAGRYTLLLPANPDAPGNDFPQGDGYATLVLAPDGTARIAGALGDGTPLTASAMLAQDGSFQIFAPLYGGKGWLSGSVTFRAVDEVSDLDGTLDWFKPGNQLDAFYSNGFLAEVPFLGSHYTPPKAGARVLNLANLNENSLLLAGEGNLDDPFNLPFTLDITNKTQIGTTNPNSVKLNLKVDTGLFSGTFVHPKTHKTTSFAGVVFQRQNLASGMFKGSNLTGYVNLIANPGGAAAPTTPNTIIYQPTLKKTSVADSANSLPTPTPTPTPTPVPTSVISASASPANGGVVAGANTYNNGDSVVLTATTASGYSFVDWKENNAEVSTSGTYSFTASGNRTLVANFTAIQPTTLFADNFDDNSIDSAKWTTSGNAVTEAGQQMQIYTNQTDAGGNLFSQPFQISGRGVVTVTRRVFLHYGNDYAVQGFEIKIGTFTMFRIRYANMIYDSPPEKACSGIYVCRKDGNPHDVNQQADISSPVSAIWDTWYDEKVVYEPDTGMAHYYINGVLKIDYDVGILPADAGTSAKITINAWGWWTGHYQLFDDFVITQ